jgi:peptidoglycan-associated lipoprotein
MESEMTTGKWVIGMLGMAFWFSANGCAKKLKESPKEPTVRNEVSDLESKVGRGNSEEDFRNQEMRRNINEIVKTVYFALDRSDLDEPARTTLSAIGTLLKEYPQIALTIDGHCDERGTEEYKLALGEKRAKTISNYLAGYGIAEGRLNVQSHGEESPASEGHSEKAWKLNRRAEFTVRF